MNTKEAQELTAYAEFLAPLIVESIPKSALPTTKETQELFAKEITKYCNLSEPAGLYENLLSLTQHLNHLADDWYSSICWLTDDIETLVGEYDYMAASLNELSFYLIKDYQIDNLLLPFLATNKVTFTEAKNLLELASK